MKHYRAPSGYQHRPGTTALDVILYEAEELGNSDILEQALTKASRATLASHPWSDVIWLTHSKRAAGRYGHPERVEIPKGSIVLAEDGDGGYLYLLPRGHLLPKRRNPTGSFRDLPSALQAPLAADIESLLRKDFPEIPVGDIDVSFIESFYGNGYWMPSSGRVYESNFAHSTDAVTLLREIGPRAYAYSGWSERNQEGNANITILQRASGVIRLLVTETFVNVDIGGPISSQQIGSLRRIARTNSGAGFIWDLYNPVGGRGVRHGKGIASLLEALEGYPRLAS